MEQQNKAQPVQVSSNENNLGVITHILGLFTSFIGPLIMYFLYKDTATEKLKGNIINSLNFQLTFVIIQILLMIFMNHQLNNIFDMAKDGKEFSSYPVYIGVSLVFLVSLVNAVASITGAVLAAKNKIFNYYIAIKFIK